MQSRVVVTPSAAVVVLAAAVLVLAVVVVRGPARVAPRGTPDIGPTPATDDGDYTWRPTGS